MAVDGTLKFDTKIDTDGVEDGTRSVKDVIQKLISSLENLAGAVTKAFNNINVDEVAAEVKDVEQSIDSAAESIVEMANDTVQATAQAEASVEQLDDALDNITITRWNDVENEIYEVAEVLEEVEAQAITTTQAINDIAIESKDVSQEVGKIDDAPLEEMSETSNELNNMLNLIKSTFQSIPNIVSMVGERIKNAFSSGDAEITDTRNDIQLLVEEIDRYKYALMNAESEGLYFGDKEYDDAYRSLSIAEQKLKDYKKELTSVDGEQKKVSKSADKVSKGATKVGNSMKNSEKKAGKFSKALGMLGKSLMFSMVFRAFSVVTNAIKEGFQNLAQYSPETNKSISALSTSLLTLKNSFATAFSPILTAITPALQTLIGYLSQAITTAGQFFAVFLNGSTTFTKAKDAQVDYAKSLKNSAKEANKSLSSIDKVNSVSDSGSSGAASGTPNPGQMFEEVEIDSKLIDFVENLKKKLEPTIKAFERFKVAIAPFSKNVGQGLKWLYNNVLVPLGNWTVSDLIPAFLDTLGAAIGVLNSLIEVFKPYALWLWENFLKPIAEWTGGAIIEGLNSLTNGLNALSDWINNNQELVANAALIIASFFVAFQVVGLVTALAPLISTFTGLVSSGTLVSTVLGAISGAISFILSPATLIAVALGLLIYTFIDLYKNSESFRDSIAELGETWKNALEPLATFISTVLTDAWNEILLPVIDFFVTTLIPQLIDIFKQLWQKVLIPFGNFMGTVLTPVIKILTDVWMSLWKNVILPLAKAVGTTLKEAWDGIYQILTKTVIPIINTLITVLTKVWKNVINPLIDVLWKNLKPAFDTVFKGIGDLIKGLQTILSGIITFITGVFTGDWSKAWEGVKKIFKGIFDSLEAIVKTPINAIIDIINGMISGIVTGINTVIKAVNTISFDMPEWLGGGRVGFNLKTVTAPKIPKLATGAVIPPNSEFLAILGDQKRGLNIETPLETMLDAFRQANAENDGGMGGTIDLTLNIDGITLLRQLIKLDRENYDKTGKPSFT